MTIEDALKQLAKAVKHLQEARKEQMEAMAEHIEEAEKKLKEARGASEVKLSDLTPEEQEDCKGMWVRVKQPNGEIFEGIIFGFDEEDVLVLVPGESYHCWRRPDQLTLLPDYQRAFAVDGGPVKVDSGQWEKTHAMEEEFDRIKAEEDLTNSRVYKAITLASDKAGMRLVEAKITGAGDVTLNFE